MTIISFISLMELCPFVKETYGIVEEYIRKRRANKEDKFLKNNLDV